MATSMDHVRPEILIASNRGPVSFVRDTEGRVVASRAAGGLAAALTGALEASGGMWIASAMSEEDRIQAERGQVEMAAGERRFGLRYLAFDPGEYDGFYNGVSNRILWFVHHYLWDAPRTPSFGAGSLSAWGAYRRVNEAFAEALAREGAAAKDTRYLVQDYHLALVPGMLRERRPNARVAHFSHIPFAGPGYFGILPEVIREGLLRGLLGADLLGFHAERWAQNFLLCCRRLLRARVDVRRRVVRFGGRTTRIGVFPVGIDAGALREASRGAEVTRARRDLAAGLGDQRLILRVDRVELSKNVLRGFLAFEQLLDQRPAWRGNVQFLALLNPSRAAVPEYHAYLGECLQAAERINIRLGGHGWKPIEVVVKDDWPAVLAGYSLFDVLLVNPVFDGMNLVAKEGPLLNRRDGVLVLSENTGAFDQVGRHALVVNPFDLTATADAMADALEMSPEDRRRRARGLRRAVLRGPLDRWIGSQLRALDGSAG